ncbi:hypothetical protein [Actinotalea sp.]|uniref:hypothetical protein n=1 Tax=Actinotalea sp. TaxID=1872145 RepID=UPI003561ADBD
MRTEATTTRTVTGWNGSREVVETLATYTGTVESFSVYESDRSLRTVTLTDGDTFTTSAQALISPVGYIADAILGREIIAVASVHPETGREGLVRHIDLAV